MDEFEIPEPRDPMDEPDDVEDIEDFDEPDAADQVESPMAPEIRLVDGEGFPWGFLLAAPILALVVVFAVQNSEPVPVEFFSWSGEFATSIVVAVTVIVTVILTQLIGMVTRRRKRRRKAEKEELRALRGD